MRVYKIEITEAFSEGRQYKTGEIVDGIDAPTLTRLRKSAPGYFRVLAEYELQKTGEDTRIIKLLKRMI